MRGRLADSKSSEGLASLINGRRVIGSDCPHASVSLSETTVLRSSEKFSFALTLATQRSEWTRETGRNQDASLTLSISIV